MPSRASRHRLGQSADLIGTGHEGWSGCRGLSARLNAKWMEYVKNHHQREIVTFRWHLLCARHSSMHFVYIIINYTYY